MRKFLPVLVLVLSLWGASVVEAAPYVSAGSFAANAFTKPQRVAVEHSTGRVFVVDHSGSGGGRVRVYEPTAAGGDYVREFGSFQVGNPAGIAIDQADRSVYVTDTANNRIARFVPDDYPPPYYNPDDGYVSPPAGPGAGEVGSFAASIAIDPVTRDLLVADPSDDHVKRFDNSTGAFLGSFDGSDTTAGAFTGLLDVAVDSTGDVIVIDSTGDIVSGGGSSRVERFSSAGVSEGAIGALSTPSSVTVVPGTDQVAVASNQDSISSFTSLTVTVFAADGSTDSTIDLPGETFFGRVTGIAAADDAFGRIYVATDRDASGSFGANGVQRLVLDFRPEVAVEAPADLEARQVTLSGTVDPNGVATTWQVEYRQAGETAWQKAPADPADAGPGTAPNPVSVDLTGLRPNTDYQWRLTARNDIFDATVDGADFHTPVSAPRAETLGATSRTTSGVRLNGIVDPYGQRTTYYFEYGPTTSYGTTLPSGDAAVAGSATRPLRVFRNIEGLSPGQTLHYRIVATNDNGTTTGQDHAVEIPAAQRAYELVTPVDKNGVQPIPLTNVKSGPSGGELAFLASGALGSNPPAVTGTNLYLSRRGSQSWTTSGLGLPWDNLGQLGGVHTGGLLAISDDMSHGFGASTKALAPGATEGDVNLYITDTRTGAVHYTGGSSDGNALGDHLSSDIPPWRAATSDFDHFVFWSVYDYGTGVPPGATGADGHLFEATGGSVRLASVDPDGQPVIVNIGGMTGLPPAARNLVSEDGRRIFMESNIGLAMREDGLRTVVFSGSRRTGEEGTPTSVTLWDASDDGSVVFFSTGGPLLNSSPDPTRGAGRLYRYTTATDELDELYLAPAGSGVDSLGVSDDGESVFFVTAEGIKQWRLGEGVRQVSPPVAVGQRYVRPDGTGMTFVTSTKLVAEHGSGDEVYVYESAEDRLTCASCNPTGSAGGVINLGGGAPYPQPDFKKTITGYSPRNLDSGGGVYFQTDRQLTGEDADGAWDVYYSRRGDIELITPGTSTDSLFRDASEDGEDVYFRTRDRLVGVDRDDSIDLYTARLGGGLAGQVGGASGGSCSGDACQGHLDSPAGDLRRPGTGEVGSGNEPVRVRQALVLSGLSRTQRSALARGLRVGVRVSVRTSSRVSVKLTGRVRGQAVTLARGSRRAAREGTVTVSIRLTKNARRSLAGRGRLRVTLAATAGVGVSRTRVFTLASAAKSKRSTASSAARRRSMSDEGARR